MNLKIIVPIIAIVGILIVSGCVQEEKITFEEFDRVCKDTGGTIRMPTCGSPQDPDCPERESVCGCAVYSIYYKDVRYIGWNGC